MKLRNTVSWFVAALTVLLVGWGTAVAADSQPAPVVGPPAPTTRFVLADPAPQPSGGSQVEGAPVGEPTWVELEEEVLGEPAPPLLQSDPVLREELPPEWRTPAPRISWNGIIDNPVTWIPPDTHIAVGPGLTTAGRVVEVTNAGVQIWDKSGVVVAGPTALGVMFTAAPGSFMFDPKVLYDQHSGRFFIVALERNAVAPPVPATSLIHIAVSTNSTPGNLTNNWTFLSGSGLQNLIANVGPPPVIVATWADYPGIGADASTLFVTTNQFDANRNFIGSNIRVFDKSVATGLLAGIYSFVDINYSGAVTQGVSTIQPAHVYGVTDNGGFYLISRWSFAQYRLFKITGHPALPVVTTGMFAWAAGMFPADTTADQCVVALPDLDTLASRVQNAVYRSGHLWCCLTSDPDNDGQTEVVWQDITTNLYPNANPAVFQSGFINGSTGYDVWTYMPSINVSAAGDAAICYTESSPTICPNMSYVTRAAVDPLGTFQVPVIAVNSNPPGWYDSFWSDPTDPQRERWGDYSGCVVDPTDDCFWAANEFANTSAVAASTWGTFIASFCMPPPTVACCFSKTVCADLTVAACVAAGGTARPAGSKCPTQGVMTAQHGSITVVHWTNPAIDCYKLKKAGDRDCIPGLFIDAWMTAPKNETHDDTCHVFGSDTCSPPIPPGFFGPGSDPFEGEVCLNGVPLGTTPYGSFEVADTLIQRQQDPFDPCDLAAGTSVVPTEMVGLNLVSLAPITVTYYGGMDEEQWDVSVGLSQYQPTMGYVQAYRSHCNGGTYSSDFNVWPKFTFTRIVPPPPEVKTLDTGNPIWGLCAIHLHQVVSPWVIAADPNLALDNPWCSDFHPSIEDPEQLPLSSCDCNVNGRRDDCDIAQGLSQDCQSNGVPDECDPDADVDLVPDDCDNCPEDYNPVQEDTDGDLMGDACDPCPMQVLLIEGDHDGDRILDTLDNCRCVPNRCQKDTDSDGIGNVCDVEPDGDYDHNENIDLADYAHWTGCMNGPGGGGYPPECAPFDFDSNTSIDLWDFYRFQEEFGPCIPGGGHR
ncbi:MAG: thrombospondin type 3 repeat-containing protein [Planctomycetota bacterium]